ncbi:hypothetical protein [Nocardioides mesophilus]|uniref:Uncharacterized protein n=1 Tax=Nocardioides mesophilus TaxID=433659 RepID=A0A7G9R6M6_9ACTN|nr:hypothetical protein [Nocardioides mesophilus]QNN51251.1 hypothetical protein H9L09_11440 [Nocardioides mesophilus]
MTDPQHSAGGGTADPGRPDTAGLAGRAAELLQAPLAAAVFVLAHRHGLLADALAEPATATALAAAAADALDPWNGAEPAAHARRRFVDQAAELHGLVNAVLSDPRTGWWAAPLDRDHQLLLSEPDTAPAPTAASARWQTYAQQPAQGLITSTELPVPQEQPIRSGAHAALASGRGDWTPTYPLVQARVRVAPRARIFEIAGPADWHRLVTRYGDPAGYAGPDRNLLEAADIDHGPAPVWDAAAADFDGVHLTFVGLLSALFVPWSQSGVTTTLWSWEWERTLWLRPAFADRTALPDLVEQPTAAPFRP